MNAILFFNQTIFIFYVLIREMIRIRAMKHIELKIWPEEILNLESSHSPSHIRDHSVEKKVVSAILNRMELNRTLQLVIIERSVLKSVRRKGRLYNNVLKPNIFFFQKKEILDWNSPLNDFRYDQERFLVHSSAIQNNTTSSPHYYMPNIKLQYFQIITIYYYRIVVYFNKLNFKIS